MTIRLTPDLLEAIEGHAESAYPEEGAGLLLGEVHGEHRRVTELLPLPNRYAPESRTRRYQIDARDMLAAEDQAEARGLDILGVFHSHPDHPARPSDFDLEWALPWYSYLITSVVQGHARETLAWKLRDQRDRFEPQEIRIRAASTENLS